MARAKATRRNTRGGPDQDRYTADLSSGQLVIGVCMLLMFGLACFILGVIIGKFDPSLRPAETAEEKSAPEVMASRAAPTPPAATTLRPGVERPRADIGSRQSRPVERGTLGTRSSVDSSSGVATRGETPRFTNADVAAPTSTASTTPDQASISSTANTPPTQVAAKVDLPSAGVLSAPKVETPKETPQEAANSSAPAPKRFGVQIAAFTKRASAERLIQQLESTTSYTAEVVVSKSGRLMKVVVGSYADQPTANRVREDLRDNHNFSDCYITAR